MNDTCRKTIPRGMMNKAFTVFGTGMAAFVTPICGLKVE